MAHTLSSGQSQGPTLSMDLGETESLGLLFPKMNLEKEGEMEGSKDSKLMTGYPCSVIGVIAAPKSL